MDEDVKIIAYCEECRNAIYQDDDVYIDDDGNYFCSVECVLGYHKITKVET